MHFNKMKIEREFMSIHVQCCALFANVCAFVRVPCRSLEQVYSYVVVLMFKPVVSYFQVALVTMTAVAMGRATKAFYTKSVIALMATKARCVK